MEVAAKGMALHHASAPLQFTSQTPNKRSYYEKLAVRLDIPAGETFGYEHVHIIDSSNEVCILIKKDDQVVLLRDDKNLFPSDALIAKIRLL
jgi:transcriptional antiterminator Rof (Rho-off)